MTLMLPRSTLVRRKQSPTRRLRSPCFEALATVCDRVKDRLQIERNRLVSALPDLPPEYRQTPAGKLYSALKHDLSKQEIQRVTQWANDDEEGLRKLTERLNAEDPAKLAERKRNTKRQLDQFGAELKNAAVAVGTQQVEALRNARSKAHKKRRIAAEAAQLGGAKLDGIGTETWNALWEAARVYSQTGVPWTRLSRHGGGCTVRVVSSGIGSRGTESSAGIRIIRPAAPWRPKPSRPKEPTVQRWRNYRQNWMTRRFAQGVKLRGLTEDGWTEQLEAFWPKWARRVIIS